MARILLCVQSWCTWKTTALKKRKKKARNYNAWLVVASSTTSLPCVMIGE